MNELELIRVGLITKERGLNGEIAVKPLTDEPERFRRLKKVFIEYSLEEILPEIIESVRFQRGKVILKFFDCDDVEAARKYRGCYISITREYLNPLKKGRYYVFDLVGSAVYDINGAHLGELVDVLETGGNDVYVVKPSALPQPENPDAGAIAGARGAADAADVAGFNGVADAAGLNGAANVAGVTDVAGLNGAAGATDAAGRKNAEKRKSHMAEDILLPAIKSVIQEINIKQKRIIVNLDVLADA